MTDTTVHTPAFKDLISLGNAFLAVGSYEPAIAAYSGAIRLRPDHALALLARAYIHSTMGKFSEAAEDFAAAVALDPSLEDTHTVSISAAKHLAREADGVKGALPQLAGKLAKAVLSSLAALQPKGLTMTAAVA